MNLLVTPIEAVKLTHYRTIEDFVIVENIENAFSEHSGYNKSDVIWYYRCLLATIYNAGRIQGIREERLKAKS